MNKDLHGNLERETPTIWVNNSCRKQGRAVFGLLLTAFFAVFFGGKVWAQNDLTGIYYIASGGRGAGNSTSSYSYNSQTPANNFYLCPTEGWCYYAPVNDFTGTDNDKPFLTTYKCRNGVYDATKAVWTIEKAPNSEYYYIKQTSTGRYLLANGQIRTTTNPDRVRIHLGVPDDPNIPDDEELEAYGLFDITRYPANNPRYYVIKAIGITDNTNPHNNHTSHKWFTVNNGNYLSLVGESGKDGGPTGYTLVAGTVGIYTDNDNNAPFYLEPATVNPPTITNNFDGTITITAAEGATIYYTTDNTEPTTSSSTYSAPITLTDGITVIKAVAKGANDLFPSLVTTYNIPVCNRPVISVSGTTATITCSTSNATIYYALDNASTTPSTLYEGPFNTGNSEFIRAIATSLGYLQSAVAYYYPAVVVHSSDEITNMEGRYIFADDFTSTAPVGTQSEPFQGQIDGNFVVLSDLDHPLVAYADGATIKNVMLKSVTISSSGNVGAICNEATGAARIYNCGILPTTTKYNSDGSVAGFTGSTVGSSNGYCGSLVGLLDGTARVINCFSYATITGGTTVAGIVGQNNQVSTMNDIKTIVVNCVFFGEITGGSTVFPVYGGNIIENKGATGINNYNYYRGESAFDDDYTSEAAYNRSWPAAEKNMRRFEYYRSILNSNRRLCTWWVNGANGLSPSDEDVESVDIAKWVIDPSMAPFPVLKRWGKYPSIINIDSEKVYDTLTKQWVNRTNARPYQGKKLGTLTVTIKTGAHPGTVGLSVINDESRTLVITDMDTLNYDYCYCKVQLPYYNEVFGNPNLTESMENHVQRYYGNYTDSVVTGWKITAVTTDGTQTYHPFVKNWENGYNYADRYCTAKDIYDDNDNRAFAQGGYYYVPEGVTGITIEAYWGKAFYLQSKDYSLDRMDVAGEKNYGRAFTPAGTRPNRFKYKVGSSTQGIDIYNEFNNIMTAVKANQSCNVYDQAIVLLGNFPLHAEDDFKNSIHNNGKGGVTMMSADLDMDNEPDFCFPFQWRAAATYTRFPIMPFRFDFLPIPELGMAMRHNKYAYSIGIFVPTGHFEITETAFIYTTQFEYMSSYTPINHQKPLILNGGQYEQIVCHGNNNAGTDIVNYTRNIILGGHIWMKRFTPGSHTGRQCRVRHCAVSVMGGEFPEFYLSGLYRAAINTDIAVEDSPHCYTNGGRFGIMAGAATESVKKDVVFQIDHSIIREFYGGGCNSANPVEGNINVTINNSLVLDKYCGGPKVGEMKAGKDVITNATGTHFCHDFFGGGNGGTNLYREELQDKTPDDMPDENAWRTTYGFNAFNPVHGGNPFDIEKGYYAEFEFEVFNQSNGLGNQAVARTYQHWAQFGSTRTGNIENNLTGCVIDGDFYGGGSLGNVGGGNVLGDKSVVSTLTSDTIYGNVFGAGYSAEIPSFQAHDKTTISFPKRDAAGLVVPASISYDPKKYTWCYKVSDSETIPPGITIPSTATTTNPTFQFPANSGHWYCLTTKTLVDLGQVSGDVTLILQGETVVGTEGDSTTGNVFGGGAMSGVTGNTTVKLMGKSHVMGSVYGGGDKGIVEGNASVSIEAAPQPTPTPGQQQGGE